MRKEVERQNTQKKTDCCGLSGLLQIFCPSLLCNKTVLEGVAFGGDWVTRSVTQVAMVTAKVFDRDSFYIIY